MASLNPTSFDRVQQVLRSPRVQNLAQHKRVALLALGALVVVLLTASLVRTFTGDAAQSAASASAVASSSVQNSVSIPNLSDGREGRAFALTAGRPLFPLPATSLSPFADDPVEMQDITVQAVVPGVGFWVGMDSSDRVFVIMREPTETRIARLALPDVAPGQTVNLSGYFAEMTSSAQAIGVDIEPDAALLNAQRYVVQANSVRF